MNTFYKYPIKPNEIYHYGMPERSGRYAWGSGDRPYQRLEKKASRMESRLRKRFDKFDKKIGKQQAVANKKFDKAVRKSNGMFASKKASKKAYDKAAEAQRKVNKYEYKTSKMYEKYSKTFAKLDIKMDSDLKAKGADYYNRTVNNSKLAYQQALSKIA